MEEDTRMVGEESGLNADQASPLLKPGQVKSRKRVAAACDRCRRQKLRCDNERPCALCVRSSLPCMSEGEGRKRKLRNEQRSKSQTSVTVDDNSSSTTLPALPTGPVRSTTRSEPSDQVVEEHFPTPESNTSQRHRERSNGPHLKQYSQGTSTIGLSQEVFRQFSSTSLGSNETGAIPGGAPKFQYVDQEVPVVEVIGIELPPKYVMDSLLDIYLNSVHWFMAVFHEASFQSEYDGIFSTGLASRRQFRYLMLLLVVLSMGARYASEQNGSSFLDVDLELLQSRLLAKVQENMIDLLDEGEIESVQICILLSSHYLYHGRPNLAFITLGTGVKSAQAMGLHNEASWTLISKTRVEIRRRVWLALYVFDRFASIVFGRPCSIRDADVEISMPEGLDGTTATHPHLSSFEILANGRREQVTTFSYQRYKFRLYEIASPIIGDIYFHHGSTFAMIATKVQHIHDQLVAWFAELPQELRLNTTFTDNSFQEPVGSSIEMTFRLQALALQLAYDNIQILLHRPLLSYNIEDITPQNLSYRLPTGIFHRRVTSLRSGSITPNSPFSISTLSKTQCWESAYRTSLLSQHENLLRKALETHAASYIGIHMFTAGTILSIVALSRPLSSRAQESKRAIARVIRMSNLFGRRTKLSAQSEKILEDFVRLVLAKEMNAILSGDGHHGRRGQQPSSVEKTAAVPSTPTVDLNGADPAAEDFQPHNRTESRGSLDVSGSTLLQEQEFAFNDSNFATFNAYDTTSFDNADFNEGILSMRQVIRDNTMTTEGSDPADYRATNIPDMNSTQLMLDSTHESTSGNTFEAFGGIRDPGQTWLWDMNPLQFNSGPLL